MRLSKGHVKFCVCVILATLLLRSSYAQSRDEFVIKSASTQLSAEIYFLNAVFEINLPSYISAAFDQGFELPLVLQVEVHRQRGYWFDKEVFAISQKYQLQYHVMLDSVSLLNVNTGHHQYFSSLEESLNHLAVLYNYPLMGSDRLEKSVPYSARINIGIDTGELPIPLKSSAWWANDWDLVSEWFEWEITP